MGVSLQQLPKSSLHQREPMDQNVLIFSFRPDQLVLCSDLKAKPVSSKKQHREHASGKQHLSSSSSSKFSPYTTPFTNLPSSRKRQLKISCCMSLTTEKVLARPWEGPERGERAQSARFDRCFSSLESKMEAKPLKELDSEKLKQEIRRWAKAVVAYARQLSGSFSSRERSSES